MGLTVEPLNPKKPSGAWVIKGASPPPPAKNETEVFSGKKHGWVAQW